MSVPLFDTRLGNFQAPINGTQPSKGCLLKVRPVIVNSHLQNFMIGEAKQQACSASLFWLLPATQIDLYRQAECCELFNTITSPVLYYKKNDQRASDDSTPTITSYMEMETSSNCTKDSTFHGRICAAAANCAYSLYSNVKISQITNGTSSLQYIVFCNFFLLTYVSGQTDAGNTQCVGRACPFTASFILLNTTLRGIQAITGPFSLSTTGFLSSSDCRCPIYYHDKIVGQTHQLEAFQLNKNL
ncbi:60S ribosomal protein L28-1 [Senna tora]|uniref:60S ribosomal protein L28-1 n=1 Tax=Senna tora TaxID=362788 RepID=A0A834XHQ0_9FABA|nr:60S ribosomal protein L28-1 [Senna tora]